MTAVSLIHVSLVRGVHLRGLRHTIGEHCEAPELKVEVRVELSRLKETMEAVRAVHPYETPVIFTIPLMDEKEA